MCKKSLFCTILLLVFAVVVNAANMVAETMEHVVQYRKKKTLH